MKPPFNLVYTKGEFETIQKTSPQRYYKGYNGGITQENDRKTAVTLSEAMTATDADNGKVTARAIKSGKSISRIQFIIFVRQK